MRHTPHRLAGILHHHPGDTLGPLLQHAARLARLNRGLQQHLPAPLGEHCKLADTRDETALVYTDSSAWAVKIRYEEAYILEILRSLGEAAPLTRIRVKIIPPPVPPPPPRPRAPLRLSATGAAIIHQAAQDINDPALQAALRRLAARSQPRGK